MNIAYIQSKLQSSIRLLVMSALVVKGLEFSSSYHVGQVGNLAAAGTSSFNGILSGVIAGGYIVMFIGMLLEGPMTTAAASFAAALGYFNIWIVLVLAILGDLVADVVYYAIGYVSRTAVIEKYGHRFGLSTHRMEKMEHLLKTHPGKTLVVIKLAPLLPVPGLMMVGATHIKFRKFATTAALIILPKVILFMALGYYFGRAYESISKYIENAQYVIVLGAVLAFAVYYGYKALTATIAQRLETI